MGVAARRRATRGLVLIVFSGVILSSALTASAESYTGTPDAKRLARQMLQFYKHVRFLSATYSGAVYYCPQFLNGYLFGPPFSPDSSCTRRGIVTQVTRLSRGQDQVQWGHVMARGRPTLTFVARRAGTYVLDPSRGCWRKHKPWLHGAPFYFSADERLTLAGRHGRYAVLRGETPDHFIERDRIDTRTHQLRGIRLVFSKSPPVQMHLRYRAVRRAPAAPSVTPVCS